MPFLVSATCCDGQLYVTPYFRGPLDVCIELKHLMGDLWMIGETTEEILRVIIFEVVCPTSKFPEVFKGIAIATPICEMRHAFLLEAQKDLSCEDFGIFLEEFEWINTVEKLLEKTFETADTNKYGHLLYVAAKMQMSEIKKNQIEHIISRSKPMTVYAVMFYYSDSLEVKPCYRGSEKDCKRLVELMAPAHDPTTFDVVAKSPGHALWQCLKILLQDLSGGAFKGLCDAEPDLRLFDTFLLDLRKKILKQAKKMSDEDFDQFLDDFQWFDTIMNMTLHPYVRENFLDVDPRNGYFSSLTPEDKAEMKTILETVY